MRCSRQFIELFHITTWWENATAWISIIGGNPTASSPWRWGAWRKDGHVVACLPLHLFIFLCWTIPPELWHTPAEKPAGELGRAFPRERRQMSKRGGKLTSNPYPPWMQLQVEMLCFQPSGSRNSLFGDPFSSLITLTGNVLSEWFLRKSVTAFGNSCELCMLKVKKIVSEWMISSSVRGLWTRKLETPCLAQILEGWLAESLLREVMWLFWVLLVLSNCKAIGLPGQVTWPLPRHALHFCFKESENWHLLRGQVQRWAYSSASDEIMK